MIAFLLGAALTAVFLTQRTSALRAQLASLQAELVAEKHNLADAREQLTKVTDELRLSTEGRSSAERENTRLSEKLLLQDEHFAKLLQTQQEQARESAEQLTHRLTLLANGILEQNSAKFTEQNQKNLGQLLEPLAEKIKGFQEQVATVYDKETRDRTALAEQVRNLMSLNQQLSSDTTNLARALTTQSKVQGDLGEMILEKILESSGLRKGEEYRTQSSYRAEDNRQQRPDVIVNLPEDRHLIIDSKLSLTAYNELVNAPDDTARAAALARHLDSVRKHIKELAEKNYQALHQLQSIDFVCMFVPIEGAFMAAIGGDQNLWTAAYEKNVLLMSPSTLLFVVRTVAHLWRQERQNRNVAEIVSRGAELYDKLNLFVESLLEVGKSIGDAHDSYETALKRLSQGKGNVIRQAEMLKTLGVAPKKNLPQSLLDDTAEAPLLEE
jgi:DNA recombination protein RmuC